MEKFIPPAKSQVEELGATSVHKAGLEDAALVLKGVQEQWMKEQEQKVRMRHESWWNEGRSTCIGRRPNRNHPIIKQQ